MYCRLNYVTWMQYFMTKCNNPLMCIVPRKIKTSCISSLDEVCPPVSAQKFMWITENIHKIPPAYHNCISSTKIFEGDMHFVAERAWLDYEMHSVHKAFLYNPFHPSPYYEMHYQVEKSEISSGLDKIKLVLLLIL